MVKIKIKRCITLILALILAVCFFSQQLLTVSAVAPSKVDYRVFLKGTKIFIHNKNALSSAIGTEYYFTYTVEEVTKKSALNGIAITDDAKRAFPYTNGGFMRYQPKDSVMLDEGSTYFVKVTVASGGFRYDITRAKNEKLENIILEKKTGDASNKVKYVGLWLYDGNVEATLRNFRFYDNKGNDLEVIAECGSGSADVILQNLHFRKATDIDHRYEIVVDNKYNIAISNTRVPTSSKTYIQYTVKSAEYTLNQTGIALSNTPKDSYPHGKGVLKYIQYPENTGNIALLEPGCDYVIEIVRGESDYKVVVQKTKGKTTEMFFISKSSGDYKSSYDYTSLWFGTGERRATLHLTDFLIYDGNRNNLGVQTNVDSTIKHTGELEDYAGCEGTYFCKENNKFIALYEDQTMKFTSGKSTENAQYRISKNVLTARFSSGQKQFKYLFKRITDSEKNEYERLSTYKVQFVTGSDTEIPMQVLSNKTGYQALKPTDPKLDGCKFEGWVTSDNRDFDFNQIVVKSTTLYAKWSGNDGRVFTSANWGGSLLLRYGSVILAVIILAAGIYAGVIFVKKGLGKR